MVGISSMEKIVRPFTAPNYSPRPRNLSFNIQNVPAGVDVTISGTGGKIFTYGFDFSSSFTPTADNNSTFREQRRVEETVRVSNPEDAAQFVDTKQATEVDLATDPNANSNNTSQSTPVGSKDWRQTGVAQRIKLIYNRTTKPPGT